MNIWLGIGVSFVALVAYRLLSGKKIIKITDPSAGFLNLKGTSAAAFLQEDRDAVRPSFYSISESESAVPRCDVLFLYADVQADGSLLGTDRSLRELIADSGAKIAILATDDPDQHYRGALKSEGARANIVWTLDRRGWRFSNFMKRLFEGMEKGPSMPIVWVRLAPQDPNAVHEDGPSTLFVAELGQVRFPYSR